MLLYPEDLIFADYDGIVVVPKSAENRVFKMAKDLIEIDGTQGTVLCKEPYPVFHVIHMGYRHSPS